jgi:hypothetical protein
MSTETKPNVASSITEFKSERVRIDTSSIISNPTVRWADTKFRKFDILSRIRKQGSSSECIYDY